MYDSFLELATNLIERFGRETTLYRHRTEAGGYTLFNPKEGKYTNYDAEPDSFPVKIVKTSFREEWTANHPIQEGDIFVLMAADSVRPQTNDIVDGYRVYAFEPLEPADTTILYKVHLRK